MRRAKFSKLKATLAGIALITTAVSLSGCTNPLEADQPFASGDVPVEATDFDCQSPQANEPKIVSGELAVIAAPTNTFVRFSNAIKISEVDIRNQLNSSGMQISTVLASATPRQTSLSWVDFSESISQNDRNKAVNRAIGKIRTTYYCAVVTLEQNDTAYDKSAGANFLGALQTAAETFTHAGVPRSIVVLGNGLQDFGQLDLSQSFPAGSQSATRLARDLAGKGALPDLAGAKVYWYGLGQTDGVIQKALHPLASKALETLWAELIKASGGELVKVVKTIPYAEPVSTSIQVKAIEVPDPPCVFMLTAEGGFSFTADSADFLDAAKATEGAETMAAEIARSNCSGPLYVVGYAASGVDKRDYNAAAAAKVKSISASRAVAFKALLEKAGVEIKLVPVGAGKGPTNDWDPSGKFIEDMGKQNRFVEITQSKPEGN